MRHPALAITGLIVLGTVVVFLPRFTAPRTEAERKRDLARQSVQASATLVCPVADERDALLSHPGVVNVSWLPVCREVPPPSGRVIIEQVSRADYKSCRERLHGNALADCLLDEPLAFLADDRPRTLARMKLADVTGLEVVWVTPKPLAWGDHLIDEHRWLLLFTMFALTLSWLLLLTGWHARTAYVLNEGMRSSRNPMPRWAGFWLSFFLHPYAHELPDDLQDNYERWLEDYDREMADALCWEDVRRNIPELILMHLRDNLLVLGRFVR